MSKAHLPASLLCFVLIGGAFAALYSGLTSALISFADAPAVATNIAVYLGCIPPAFYCQRRFAFGQRQSRKAAFPLYVATQVFGLAASSSALTTFATKSFWPDTTLLLFVSAMIAIVSFLMGRFVTFAQTR
ncbi:GtrA family protein [Pseudorhodobacter sp.]|uniref:GtrA family protein n=1 Tax=Pseudorhodobacter sp. TaxID=1934400 RepID=UPI002649B70E|nr:GtrA family protein [Pseudorhodobacter sp.]MDN5785617.1 GtrA family protein [Pseudorhodobacter sp.]